MAKIKYLNLLDIHLTDVPPIYKSTADSNKLQINKIVGDNPLVDVISMFVILIKNLLRISSRLSLIQEAFCNNKNKLHKSKALRRQNTCHYLLETKLVVGTLPLKSGLQVTC